MIRHLIRSDGVFILGIVCHSGTKEIKTFIADVSALFEPHVHTKINNKHAKHQTEVQRRLKSMEMI